MSLPLLAAYVGVFSLSVVVLGVVVVLKKAGVLSTHHARKVMHIATGPTFLICCTVFPDSRWSPPLVASISWILAAYFALVGMGVLGNASLVATVSRSGKRTELLSGPVLYGLVVGAGVGVYWLTSPIGVVAIITLCFGDGVADIVGRRYGESNPLPWNGNKSWAGSAACEMISLMAVWIFAMFLCSSGHLCLSLWGDIFPRSVAVVTAATLVESLPIPHYDNVTVFVTCVLVGHCVW